MHSGLIRLLSCLVLLSFASFAPAEELPGTPANAPMTMVDFSTVVASPDIKEPLTNVQLSMCMRETARVMKIDTPEKPQIVVLQLSPAEAKRLGMSKTVLLSNRGQLGPRMFYEVWLVGPYGLADLTHAIEMVYETHFGLKYNDKSRAKVVNEVARHMYANSTVDVKTLREENQSR